MLCSKEKIMESKKKFVTIQMGEELKSALAFRAIYECRTMSSLIREILADYLRKNKTLAFHTETMYTSQRRDK
jgi:hypothetical protein